MDWTRDDGRSVVALKRTTIMLCLIQSGETTWQTDGRVRGATDLPLSDAGRSLVTRELRGMQACDAPVIHHPPDEAAAETARLAAEHIGAKTKPVADLADPNLGLLEGLTLQEFRDRFPSRFKQWEDDPMSLAPPEGELMLDAAGRLFRAIAKTLRRSRGGEVALVLHSMGLGMLRAWLADRPLNDFRAMLENRPGVERYALSISMVDGLEKATSSAATGS